jgi:hypothetical protein
MVYFTEEKAHRVAAACEYVYLNSIDIDEIVIAVKGMYVLSEMGFFPMDVLLRHYQY